MARIKATSYKIISDKTYSILNKERVRTLFDTLGSTILDSRLITRVRLNTYQFKIVECGDYVQLYYYSEPKRKKSDVERLDINNLKKRVNIRNGENKIEDRNIMRTKLNCQRLAKANASDWRSFITLTYAENMQDMKQAKLDLNYFIKNVKKVKKDFKYIAIPEFQKRGAIHFHLLSNLSLEDNQIIIPQKNNTKYYDVKYWNKIFTSYENVVGDVKKIVGYISKYMTKDGCDERLFDVRRFSSSQNLVKPVVNFVDLSSKEGYKYFNKMFTDKLSLDTRIYKNKYSDKFDNEVVFQEYLLK